MVVDRELAAASVMHPLPLLAAVVVLVVLALRRRTLGRVTGALGVLAAAVLGRLRPRPLQPAEHRRGADAARAGARQLDLSRSSACSPTWRPPRSSGCSFRASSRSCSAAPSRATATSRSALFALVWLAAVAGDTTGFLLGRRLGRAFLLRHGPRFHITPDDRRAGRGDLRPPRRQGDHPRPLHRRGPRDHAVPRRQLAPHAAPLPGLRRRRGRRLGRILPGRRLRPGRRAPRARPRSRTRSASRSAVPRSPAARRWASGSSIAARRRASACSWRGNGRVPR